MQQAEKINTTNSLIPDEVEHPRGHRDCGTLPPATRMLSIPPKPPCSWRAATA
jgi:hypothetical protein